MDDLKTISVVIPAYRPGKKFLLQQERLRHQKRRIDKIIIINTEDPENPTKAHEEFEKFFSKSNQESEALENSLKASSAEEPLENTSGHKEAVLKAISGHKESVSDVCKAADCILPETVWIDIKKKDFDHGRTRNLGIDLSSTDYVLFMTDDAVPLDDTLTYVMAEKLDQDLKTGAVYGRQLPGKESSLTERLSREFNYPDKDLVKGYEDLERLKIKTFFQSNVCCMYRRSVLVEAGKFPEGIIFNEDMVFCERMLAKGYKSFYASKARVEHSHSYSYREQFRRNFDLGVSQYDYREVFSAAPSEGEGIRLLRSLLKKALSEGKILEIPGIITESGFKYLGYRAGKAYRFLPGFLIKHFTMNKSYWEGKK